MKKGSNYCDNPSDTFMCGHPRDRTNMRFVNGCANCLICSRASQARYREKRRNQELLAHARPHLYKHAA